MDADMKKGRARDYEFKSDGLIEPGQSKWLCAGAEIVIPRADSENPIKCFGVAKPFKTERLVVDDECLQCFLIKDYSVGNARQFPCIMMNNNGVHASAFSRKSRSGVSYKDVARPGIPLYLEVQNFTQKPQPFRAIAVGVEFDQEAEATVGEVKEQVRDRYMYVAELQMPFQCDRYLKPGETVEVEHVMGSPTGEVVTDGKSYSVAKKFLPTSLKWTSQRGNGDYKANEDFQVTFVHRLYLGGEKMCVTIKNISNHSAKPWVTVYGEVPGPAAIREEHKK